MNPVYLRMALYTLAIALSSLGIGTMKTKPNKHQ